MYTSIEIFPKMGGWIVFAQTEKSQEEIVFTEIEHMAEFIKNNLPSKPRS